MSVSPATAEKVVYVRPKPAFTPTLIKERPVQTSSRVGHPQESLDQVGTFANSQKLASARTVGQSLSTCREDHKLSLSSRKIVNVESDDCVYCLSKAEASREKENIGVGMPAAVTKQRVRYCNR